MTNFSDRLKELRIEKRLTQEQLANKFYLNKSSISRYERGQQVPELELLQQIADFFSVSTDYLLGNSDIKNPYSEKTLEEKYPDVNDIEEAMKIILAQPGLMLKGELLSDESKIILANAIQMGLRTAEELEKKKNKGDGND